MQAHSDFSILIATIQRPTGDTGVQTHFNEVIKLLKKSNIPVELATPFSYFKSLVYPVFGLRKVIHLFSTNYSVWWYRYWHAYFLEKHLKTRLKTTKEMVIYAQCPLSAKAALKARSSKNQKVIMVVHFNISQAHEWAEKQLIPQHSKQFKDILNLEAKTLLELDGIIYVSKFMQEQITNRVPQIYKIPHRIIPNFLEKPNTLLQIPTIQNELITIGSLEARKNQVYALEIINESKSTKTPLSLTIVGSGPDEIYLRKKAQELNIEGQVTFKGKLPNAANLIYMHKAYIQTSKMESFGITLIEAISRGKPVFAPNRGGMPETFEAGVSGDFIPLNDSHKAAQIIVNWINSPHKLQQASIEGPRFFRDNFEAEKVSNSLLRFFSDIAHLK